MISESEKQKLFLESLEVATWEWDILSGIETWSDEYLNLLGFERGELREDHQTFLDQIIHPDHRFRYEKALEDHFIKGKAFKLETLLKTKLRSYRWFQISGKAVHSEGLPVYMVGSIEDINARRTIEIDRQLQELILEEVAEVARIGVWEAQLSSDSVKWSKEVFRIHELEDRGPLSLDEAFAFYLPESQEQMRISFLNTLRNKEPYDLILQIKTAGGKVKWIRSICKPLLDEKGEIIKLRGIVQDIDGMMREQKMQQNKSELIQDQNDRLMNFAHIVSHNLRSHASNLSGLTRLLSDPDFQKDDFNEILGHLSNLSLDLTKTIGELSELVQVQTRLTSQKSYMKFSSVLENVLAILNNEMQDLSVDIQSDFKVEGIVFVPSYLSSIFLNLLSNALKYRKPDSKEVHIELKSFMDEDHVVLEVADKGRGIDLKRYGSKVFGLYETFHYHNDSRGVGLYLVRNQLESQGAKISLESTVNEGTTFRIDFSDLEA